MSSRRYISYKFIYDTDWGQQTIKRHRSYLNLEDLSEQTPTTQLFFDRVLYFEEKVTGTSKGLRHLLCYTEGRQLKAKIPYAPGDSRLIEHIQEILSLERVDCADYWGEYLIVRNSTDNFLDV